MVPPLIGMPIPFILQERLIKTGSFPMSTGFSNRILMQIHLDSKSAPFPTSVHSTIHDSTLVPVPSHLLATHLASLDATCSSVLTKLHLRRGLESLVLASESPKFGFCLFAQPFSSTSHMQGLGAIWWALCLLNGKQLP